jgi:membrane-associated phospholipid phosphatase
MFFYFMHFPLPIVVGFYFWVNSREHFRRFVAALLLMSFLAFITYLFFPSAPPWYQFPGQVVKINNETVQVFFFNQYSATEIYNSFNPNKFAAFPTLHTAFPALAAAYAWSRYRALAFGLIAWSAAVLLSIVYLGEHYVVDALDGFIYVAVAMAIVELVARRLARRTEARSLSTPARPSA